MKGFCTSISFLAERNRACEEATTGEGLLALASSVTLRYPLPPLSPAGSSPWYLLPCRRGTAIVLHLKEGQQVPVPQHVPQPARASLALL